MAKQRYIVTEDDLKSLCIDVNNFVGFEKCNQTEGWAACTKVKYIPTIVNEKIWMSIHKASGHKVLHVEKPKEAEFAREDLYWVTLEGSYEK